jgi:hypothetical protein
MISANTVMRRALGAETRNTKTVADLNNILTSLHNLRGHFEPDLVAGISRASDDLQKIIDTLQGA